MAFVTTPLPVSRSTFTPSIAALRPIPRAHAARNTPRARPLPLAQPIRAEKTDRTFIAVKPDGMNRGLLGNIVSRFEARGLKLVAIKTLIPSRELAETHYASLSSKPFFPALVDFITSGPVCAMVWEGEGVVKMARTMIGETKPSESAPGTIRGDFGIDVGRKYVSALLPSLFCSMCAPLWVHPLSAPDRRVGSNRTYLPIEFCVRLRARQQQRYPVSWTYAIILRASSLIPAPAKL